MNAALSVASSPAWSPAGCSTALLSWIHLGDDDEPLDTKKSGNDYNGISQRKGIFFWEKKKKLPKWPEMERQKGLQSPIYILTSLASLLHLLKSNLSNVCYCGMLLGHLLFHPHLFLTFLLPIRSWSLRNARVQQGTKVVSLKFCAMRGKCFQLIH